MYSMLDDEPCEVPKSIESTFGATDPFVAFVPFEAIWKRYKILDVPNAPAYVSYILIMDIPSFHLESIRNSLEGCINDYIDTESAANRPLLIHYDIPDNMNEHMH